MLEKLLSIYKQSIKNGFLILLIDNPFSFKKINGIQPPSILQLYWEIYKFSIQKTS